RLDRDDRPRVAAQSGTEVPANWVFQVSLKRPVWSLDISYRCLIDGMMMFITSIVHALNDDCRNS
ncbi:hypothetical protein QVM13_33320, partial [Pseudomonas aeruginosa]